MPEVARVVYIYFNFDKFRCSINDKIYEPSANALKSSTPFSTLRRDKVNSNDFVWAIQGQIINVHLTNRYEGGKHEVEASLGEISRFNQQETVTKIDQ